MEKNDAILVIDDDQNIVEILVEHLQSAGHQCKGFTSWAEIEKDSGELNFYLGVVDYMIPDMNGIEICKKLKERSPDMKFIMISGIATEETIRDYVSLEIKDIFEKPLNLQKLLSRLKSVGDEVMMQRQMNHEIRVGFIEEALDLFSEVENNIIKLEASDSLLELVEELFRAFHNLKGGAAAVGYMELSGLSHKAENILNTLRGNKEPVTKTKVETLLKYNDLINKILLTYQKDVNAEIAPLLSDSPAQTTVSTSERFALNVDLTIGNAERLKSALLGLASKGSLTIEVTSKKVDLAGVQLLVALKRKREDFIIEIKSEEHKKLFDTLGFKRIYL